MQYLGDFAEDATVYIPFNTFSSDDPQASVTATTLIASDIYVHKDGSVTDIVTDGATIAIDFDSVTGNHLITIDTSAHADYSVGSDYVVRIEGATVDGGNINAFVGSFSIENRFNDVNVVTVSGTTQTANDNGADINAILLDTAEIGTAGAGLTNIGTIATVTTLTNKTGFSLAATGLDAIASTATGMVEIAKAIWDRVLTGATHNISNSAGKRLRQIDAAFEVHSGTAQAGSTTSITLDTGASATDNIYNGDRVIIIGGTGAQEHDIITAYNGTTKVATVAETWVITPDATSEFILVPASVDIETWQHSVVTGDGDWAAMQADLDTITDTDGVILGAAGVDLIWDESLAAHQAALSSGRAMTLGGVPIAETTATGTPTTTAIQIVAGSTTDSVYNDATVRILSGAGVGQARIITSYVGATKTCNFDEAFTIAPSSGDAVAISMDHIHPVVQIQAGLATEAKQDIIDTVVDQIIVDIAALNDLSAAQVNAEMVDTLNVDTYAESASVPAATASLVDKIRWLATVSRNKITQTATTQLVRNDADGATVGTSTVSDDGTTFTRGEFV